jgi:hypothetical protein
LNVPLSPLPVLSPMIQSGGSPARRRLAPVWHAIIQASNRPREAADRTGPSSTRPRVWRIASGLVVSRGSPGNAVFKVGSSRSRRVRVSPVPRSQTVNASGPPSAVSSRLAALLSLHTIAAAQRSEIDIRPVPPPASTTFRVTGA